MQKSETDNIHIYINIYNRYINIKDIIKILIFATFRLT